MSALTLHHLTCEVAGRTLFREVTLTLERGWTGLVGDNGAGKSTLLSVLAGLRAPDEGHVDRRGVVLALVPQRADAPGPLVERFVSSNDGAAQRWKGQLDLDPTGLDRWPTLSPGERQRWQLAAAMWSEPEVLLLDEPTNHLDADARERFIGVVSRFRGAGLMVSHDREVLDRLTSRTWRLARGQVVAWEGRYRDAKAEWEREETQARHDAQVLARTVDRLDTTLSLERRRLASATRQRSAGARMRSVHDSDGRGVGENFRAERAQGHLAQTVRRVVRLRDAAAESRAALDVAYVHTRPLVLEGPPSPHPIVARLAAGLVSTPDGRGLVDIPAPLEVKRDDRIAIVGPNGAGKSTLLGRIAAGVCVPPERCLWVRQEVTVAEAAADAAWLRALDRVRRGRVGQWLDALGVDPAVFLSRDANPSVGEARLLTLARGLEVRPWLLLLDEPTNHLAMALVERLEAALAHLETALVLVSHDRSLVEALTHRRWEVQGGGAALEDRGVS
jgi:ATPase subunit of ABC transporter with duplicated ATPase domains